MYFVRVHRGFLNTLRLSAGGDADLETVLGEYDRSGGDDNSSSADGSTELKPWQLMEQRYLVRRVVRPRQRPLLVHIPPAHHSMTLLPCLRLLYDGPLLTAHG